MRLFDDASRCVIRAGRMPALLAGLTLSAVMSGCGPSNGAPPQLQSDSAAARTETGAANGPVDAGSTHLFRQGSKRSPAFPKSRASRDDPGPTEEVRFDDARNLDPPAKLPAPGPDSWASFRNGNRQLGVATSKLPEKLELLWKYPATDGVVATAAIVANRVYAGLLSGELVCLDLKTGKRIWRYRSIDDPNPDTFAPGFLAAPRVTAQTVYIGDEDGLFHAVDRATGKKRWVFTTDAEIAGCAAIVGEHVIIGSHDSFLYCLKAADGSVVWKFQTQNRVNCSPAIAGKYTFVAGCDEHLRVIDIETGQQKSDIDLGTYLIASPAVMGDMLYVGTYASEVVGVNWKNEEIVWRYKDEKREFPYHASAAVTDEYVVVGGQDKQVHCIERKSGERVWVFPTRGRVDSSPVVVGKRIFVGSSDRNLYELRLKDGKQIWKYNAGQEITASPAVGEGCLVIGSEGAEGFVYCFGEKGDKEKGKSEK